MYSAATKWILGIRPGYDALTVDPCIPKNWPEFTVQRQWRGAHYSIRVTNPSASGKASGKGKGLKSLTLNGQPVQGNAIPVQAAGTKNIIEAILD
jgi:N,N'-diacetylchitobiose phosphorylase